MQLLPISPNPFAGATAVRFTLDIRETVTLDVFDVRGRQVARLWDGPRNAGEHEALWDGRTASGGAAPAGIYFFHLRARGGSLVQRAVLLP
jgi:hypothetical protein